jgi:hypothetical protein
MTDRVHALTVILDREFREDDVQAITDAIGMMRGVLRVETHVTDIDFYAAREQAKYELRQEMREVLWPGIKS